MPKQERADYVFTRTGRRGLYGWVDGKVKALQTEDTIEAITRLRAFRNESKRSTVAATAGASTPGEKTITEIFTRCGADADTANTIKTAYDLRCRLRRILRWLTARGINYPSQVTLQIVESYKADLRDRIVAGLQDETEANPIARKQIKGGDGICSVNRHLDNWRRAWKLLTDQVHAPELFLFPPSHLDGLFVKIKEARRQRHLDGHSMKELQALIEAETHPGYKLLWAVALGSGQRNDELSHMDLTDVQNPAKGKYQITVTAKDIGFCRCHAKGRVKRGWTPKNHQCRSIPVSKKTYDAARALLTEHVEIVRNPSSKIRWNFLQVTAARARLPLKISMHHFRYAFASHLHAAEFTISQISKWLGHQDVATTERYLRLTDRDLPASAALPF